MHRHPPNPETPSPPPAEAPLLPSDPAALQVALEAERTARRKAERELADVTFVIGHDLKEPLRAIQLFVGLVREELAGKLEGPAAGLLDTLDNSAGRLTSQIDAVLRLSRIGRHDGPRLSIDLGALAERVFADLIAARPARRGTPRLHVAPGLPRVEADLYAVEAVLRELLRNAVTFNESEPPEVWLSAAGPGPTAAAPGEVSVTLSDNGIGIEPRHHEEIFGLFRRLHPRDVYPGLGAGLTLARRQVEHWGGRLWLDPTAGPGATFRFTLPAAP